MKNLSIFRRVLNSAWDLILIYIQKIPPRFQLKLDNKTALIIYIAEMHFINNSQQW